MPRSPTGDDDRLRLRLFVGGQLADEAYIAADDPDAPDLIATVTGRLQNAAQAAQAEGQPWMMEAFDPTAPVGSAYVRVGTDSTMMRRPVATWWFPVAGADQ